MYMVHCTLHSIQLGYVRSTLYTVHCTLYIWAIELGYEWCTVYTFQMGYVCCTLHYMYILSYFVPTEEHFESGDCNVFVFLFFFVMGT